MTRKKNGHVEAVFAGEEVEEFALVPPATIPAPVRAVLAPLAKDFLESYGPSNARDGYGEDEQPDDLRAETHESSQILLLESLSRCSPAPPVSPRAHYRPNRTPLEALSETVSQ